MSLTRVAEAFLLPTLHPHPTRTNITQGTVKYQDSNGGGAQKPPSGVWPCNEAFTFGQAVRPASSQPASERCTANSFTPTRLLFAVAWPPLACASHGIRMACMLAPCACHEIALHPHCLERQRVMLGVEIRHHLRCSVWSGCDARCAMRRGPVGAYRCLEAPLGLRRACSGHATRDFYPMGCVVQH